MAPGALDQQGLPTRAVDSAIAREAWRAMRKRVVALSFGYLVVNSHKEGNVRVLDELDLYEISLTPTPANPATRVLSMKGGFWRIARFECVTLQWRLSAKLEDQLTRQDGFTVHAEAADYPFTLSMSSKAAREAVFGQEPATAVVDLPVRSTKQEGKEFVRMPTADPRAP
jgi:hypothetical protein